MFFSKQSFLQKPLELRSNMNYNTKDKCQDKSLAQLQNLHTDTQNVGIFPSGVETVVNIGIVNMIYKLLYYNHIVLPGLTILSSHTRIIYDIIQIIRYF